MNVFSRLSTAWVRGLRSNDVQIQVSAPAVALRIGVGPYNNNEEEAMTSVDVLCMQAACLQLINALVTCPDDLDFRLHLRNEFMRVGLHDLIEVRLELQ
jgi:hypothetical protein